MKYERTINYKEQVRKITIEPSIYQDKKVYEIAYEGQYVIIYREDNQWQQHPDFDYDEEWLSAVGHAIESIESVKVDD